MADPQQRSLLRLAAANVSIYTPHTSLDACRDGINDWLARMAAGHDLRSSGIGSNFYPAAITPSVNCPAGHEGAGMGRTAALDAPTSVAELVERTKKATHLEHGEVVVGGRCAIFSSHFLTKSPHLLQYSAPRETCVCP